MNFKLIGARAPDEDKDGLKERARGRIIPPQNNTDPMCPECLCLIKPGQDRVCVPPGSQNCVFYHSTCWRAKVGGR